MSEEAVTDDPRERRRTNKLFNERLKLLASGLNTLGVASLITLVIAPYASDRITGAVDAAIGVGAMIVLHAAGQLMLTLWRSED